MEYITMATYLALNIIFISIVFVIFRIRPIIPSKAWLISLAILMVMTVIFDSLIIAVGIVGYDTSKLLGVYLAKAPIEDLFYSLLAIIIIPRLWRLFNKGLLDA